MSDYHILRSAEKMNAAQVAFHVPIPNTNNIVGTNWRTAVSQSRNTASAVPWLDSAGQTALDNGEVIEEVKTVEYSANLTHAQKLAVIEAYFSDHKAGFLSKLQDELQYWGKEGDVA